MALSYCNQAGCSAFDGGVAHESGKQSAPGPTESACPAPGDALPLPDGQLSYARDRLVVAGFTGADIEARIAEVLTDPPDPGALPFPVRTVYLPAGTYHLANTIEVAAAGFGTPCALRIIGEYAVLQPAAGFLGGSLLRFAGSFPYLHVEGLILKGGVLAGVRADALVGPATFEQIHVEGADVGFRLTDCDHCAFRACSTGLCGEDGFRIADCRNTTIDGCVAEASGSAAFRFASTTGFLVAPTLPSPKAANGVDVTQAVGDGSGEAGLVLDFGPAMWFMPGGAPMKIAVPASLIGVRCSRFSDPGPVGVGAPGAAHCMLDGVLVQDATLPLSLGDQTEGLVISRCHLVAEAPDEPALTTAGPPCEQYAAGNFHIGGAVVGGDVLPPAGGLAGLVDPLVATTPAKLSLWTAGGHAYCLAPGQLPPLDPANNPTPVVKAISDRDGLDSPELPVIGPGPR